MPFSSQVKLSPDRYQTTTTMQQPRRLFGVTDGGHQLIGTAGEEEQEEVVRTAERSVR